MKARLKSRWAIIAGIFAVLVIVAVAITVPLLVSHNNAVSRKKAASAAQAYDKAASKYVQSLSKQMDTVNNANNDKEIFNVLGDVKKEQASRPELAVVQGAGAQLPAYKTAEAYQKKLEDFNKSLNTYLNAALEFKPFDYAYISLNDVQNDISAGKLTTGDPVTSIKTVIINPLTSAQSEFQKVTVPAKYKQLAADLNAAFKDYINSGNTLVAMYEANTLHNVDFNFVPELDKLYDEEKPVYKTLNDQSAALVKNLDALLTQAPTK